jgi:hypothetical protein
MVIHKSVWRIEAMGYALPLIEAYGPLDAINQAVGMRFQDPDSPDLIGAIYKLEKLGFLPEEFKKIGL